MAKKTNFEVNGNKYFRVTKTIGHKADGTPIRKTFYGAGINEANEKANEYMNNVKNGFIETKSSINDLMNYWIYDYLKDSTKLKPSTFDRYEGIYRNYISTSSLAGIKIDKLTMINIQNYYNYLYDTEKKTYSQIYTVNKVFKTFLNWCIDNGYILKNPTTKITIKGKKADLIRKKKKPVTILSDKEISIIKDNIKNTDFELIFLLDLASGLRRGELLALEWSDIDFENNTVTVNKSVKEVKNHETGKKETILQSPKTLNSFRTISLPSYIMPLLIKNKGEGKIFKTVDDKYITGNTISHRWDRMLEKCNIEHKKFHSIRHTYGSILLKNGADIETVAELMGHSAISITEMYLHSDKQTKSKAVNYLNQILM